MKDPDHEKKPTLRISHIVYGRERRGNRVVYLLDPKGEGAEKSIAEQVVLHRWRRREFPGYTFSGARLSPNLWRALPLVLSTDTSLWGRLTPAKIKELADRKRSDLRRRHLSVPSENVVWALIQVCGRDRLHKIVERHNAPDRLEQFGTPDLFLYATCNETGQPMIARFVEVKKPEEAVSGDQHEEIEFLKSLGLHSRILRLVERK
jgi:hypothetical protein